MENQEIKGIKPNRIFTYEAYRTLINQLFEDGKTTGENHSESMLNYTKMNIQRMKRLDKTFELTQETKELLADMAEPQRWVLITEAWCGDAAQSTPVIVAIANAHPMIQLDILLRDENPEIMNQYLTNGGKSIPKLVIFDKEGNEIGNWGPRPAELQQMVWDNKNSEQPVPYSEFSKTIQMWYNNDKTHTMQHEIMCIAAQAECVEMTG